MRAVCLVGLLSACATTTTLGRTGLVATSGERELFRGPSAWTVRATSTGREDVVAVPGVGEVIVAQGVCRLVLVGEDGVLTVRETTACAEERGDHLCFAGARFDDVVIDGCAERNEIFLDRLEGDQLASVGPTSFVERCAPIDSTRLSYMKIIDLDVDGNDRPRHGLRFRYRDGFEVCFLSRTRGTYRILLELEDPTPRRVTMSGAVDEL